MENKVLEINGRFYDFGTNNKSFLDVAESLKSIGIKNYYFMLEVKNPKVIGINPYDENITDDDIELVRDEVTKNMWYYLREVCRIPNLGNTYSQFIANRGNIAQAWCFKHGIDSWLDLPRTRYKTMSALADQSWAYCFATTDTQFNFISSSSECAKIKLAYMNKIISLLPKYLQYDSTDCDNKYVTQMKHPITKNEIIVKTKVPFHESAISIGRSLTAPIQYFDDFEFIPEIKTILDNSMLGYTKASFNARKNAKMYGRLMTSVVGNKDAEMILNETAPFNEFLYDHSQYEIDNYIADNSKNNILYIEFSYKELGLTDEWLNDMSNKIDNDDIVRREILLERSR